MNQCASRGTGGGWVFGLPPTRSTLTRARPAARTSRRREARIARTGGRPAPSTRVRSAMTLDKDLHEVHERLGGLLESATGIEFQPAVKVVAAGEDVRTRQPPEGEARAVGAAADGARRRRQSRPARRFDCIVGELRVVAEHLGHVLVLIADL